MERDTAFKVSTTRNRLATDCISISLWEYPSHLLEEWEVSVPIDFQRWKGSVLTQFQIPHG